MTLATLLLSAALCATVDRGSTDGAEDPWTATGVRPTNSPAPQTHPHSAPPRGCVFGHRRLFLLKPDAALAAAGGARAPPAVRGGPGAHAEPRERAQRGVRAGRGHAPPPQDARSAERSRRRARPLTSNPSRFGLAVRDCLWSQTLALLKPDFVKNGDMAVARTLSRCDFNHCSLTFSHSLFTSHFLKFR